jgi:DNA invertase Pin-like site-specific DNA recombinase
MAQPIADEPVAPQIGARMERGAVNVDGIEWIEGRWHFWHVSQVIRTKRTIVPGPATQRHGLSAALASVKQHGAGILLVATRDRLARDTLIAALVEQRTQQLGASIRAVDGSGNTDTPEGLLVRRIVDAFAEYERLTIQARTKAALVVSGPPRGAGNAIE